MSFTDVFTLSWTSGLTRPFNNTPVDEDLYLLLDTYSVDYVAGSVNGTYANTGQLRTVSDTNSKLSISNENLSLATGGVGASNPAVYYPSIVRTAGRILFSKLTLADTTSNIVAGWDNTSGGALQDAVTFAGGALVKVISNGATIAFGTGFPASATTYNTAVILRAAGAFFFVKGGAFTNWTLLWSSTVTNSTPLFPAVGTGGGTTTVVTFDKTWIPFSTSYFPAPSASDSFTRANGALGTTNGLATAEANGGGGLTWTGSTWAITSNAAVDTPTTSADVIINGIFAADTDWTKGTGWTIAAGVGTVTVPGSASSLTEAVATTGAWYLCTFTVAAYVASTIQAQFGATTNLGVARSSAATFTETGRATSTLLGFRGTSTSSLSIDNVSFLPLTLSSLFATVSGQATDVHVMADVTLATGMQAGIVVSLDSAASPANFVIAYHDGTNAHLEKCVAGTYTSLINTAASYVAGKTLRVIKFGTAYILYYNDVIVGTQQTVADAGIISNTIHGLFSTSSSNSFTNFIVRPLGSSNEYFPLDAL